MIGRNGAGKSTLLKILTRITKPTAGRVGDPRPRRQPARGGHRLPPGAHRPREHLPERRDPRHEAARDPSASFDDIVEFSGVEEFLDTPVKRYSSGMYVRLAFSVAAHLEPEILLVDEVLARRRRRVPAALPRPHGGVRRDRPDGDLRLAQLQAVAQLCDRAILSTSGRIVLRRARAPRSSPTTSAARRRGLGARPGTTRTTHRATTRSAALGTRRRAGRGTARRRRRPRASRRRDRVPRAARRAAGRAEDQAARPGARSRSTPWTRRALAHAIAARRVRGDGMDPGQLAERGARQRRRRGLLDRLRRSSTTTSAVTRRSRSTCRTRPRATRRAAFTGQWRGVVRPLLDWTIKKTGMRGIERLIGARGGGAPPV